MDTVKILEPCIQALGSKDSQQRNEATKRLATLMKEHHLFPISLIKMNGLKPLIRLLGSKEAASGEKAYAALTLGLIAKNNVKHQEAIGAPGLTALVKLLKEGKAVERSQATFALAQLLQGQPRYQVALVKLGALPLLVQQLSGETEGDFGSAAFALAMLAQNIEAHQTAIRLEGAVEVLASRLHGESSGDRIDAAFALAHLATGHAKNQEAIFEAEVVEGLMLLLNSSFLAERMNAMLAITRIADDYEPAQTAFGEVGAIASLVKALQCNTARQAALIALHSVAKSHAENQQAIVQSGALETLVRQLRTGMRAERRHAALILSTMVESNEEVVQMVDQLGGTIPLRREQSLL
ncbi:unnamed protein product [Effrenium voratum]|uniref:Uncharacterized protein n=1 Tax=Effrenium voratum TaxID=2562239 RepID=A0AA36JRH8_9DINO|nr:unnamed protein product [Effrenium voratum]CAJ1457855.1 unnamed protein product [Effrenium voratum]